MTGTPGPAPSEAKGIASFGPLDTPFPTLGRRL